jgi:signal transduction histidine kinase
MPLDIALALGFAAVGQAELRASMSQAYKGTASLAVNSVAAMLVSLPLVWRRRAPVIVLVTVAAAIILPRMAWDTTVLFFGGLFPLLVALYSASCYARAPRELFALLVPAATLVGLSIEIPAFRRGGEYASTVGAFAGAWLVGQGTRRWRATSERLAAALAELDATASLRERGAVDDERARIARELHDVVGHSISVMLLQAGAARLELHAEQSHARQALEAVEITGRAAMAEMRRMVGVMRPESGSVQLAAPPSLQRLGPLLEQMRQAGLDVSLRETGSQRALSPGLDLSAYRIVQEALTNVARHAGAVPVVVEVAYGPDALLLEVRNEPPSAPHESREPIVSGGKGLLGMRERVALFGGKLDAGPSADGGFAVRARLRLDVAPG